MIRSTRSTATVTRLLFTLSISALLGAARPTVPAVEGPFAQALQTGDATALRSLLADEVRFMPPFSPSLIGAEDAVAYFPAFVRMFAVESYAREPLETLDLGSQRVDCGTFTIELRHRESGDRLALAGKYQDIWQTPSGTDPLLRAISWNFDFWPPNHERLRVTLPGNRQLSFEEHLAVTDDISFEIYALNQAHEMSVAEHDAALWGRLFAADAMTLPNNAPVCHGGEAINAYLARHVPELPVFEKLDVRTFHIDVLGDYVIEYGGHIAVWRNGDYSGVGTGKGVRIWRRSPEGPLKLFRTVGSYD
jgi:ketosteroid isomerase-like protein